MIGSMGQGGQAFVRGINDSGELIMRWLKTIKQLTVSCIISSWPNQKHWEAAIPYYLNNLTCKVANH